MRRSDHSRDLGLVLLVVWGLAVLVVLPVGATVLASNDLGMFLVSSLIFGPLALLLWLGGRRDDRRRPSAGFARRAGVMATVAGLLLVLSGVVAVTGGDLWIALWWSGVLGLVLARTWGAFDGVTGRSAAGG